MLAKTKIPIEVSNRKAEDALVKTARQFWKGFLCLSLFPKEDGSRLLRQRTLVPIIVLAHLDKNCLSLQDTGFNCMGQVKRRFFFLISIVRVFSIYRF